MAHRIEEIGSHVRKLREVSAKLRSLSHLIENQAEHLDEPLDMGEIYWGIGLLLSDFSENVQRVAKELDKREIF